MNIAIILAGGSGTRIGGDTPKQFLRIGGKTIMEHSIDAFERNNHIDEIAIVTREDLTREVQEIVHKVGYKKVKKILIGGKERYYSTISAITAYENEDDSLLFHDCVRPFVSQRIIDDCVDALKNHRAVSVAVPTTDTIVQIDGYGHIVSIPPRAMLMNSQTPQCFRRSVIAEAFRRALADPAFNPTDDCGVVHRYLPQEDIIIVAGEASNIKITYPHDLDFAENYLRKKQD